MELLIAEVDGNPTGAMQIIDPAKEATHYWGLVATNLRAIDIWIGEEAILIDPLASNVDSHQFYKRLGFVFVEQRQFGESSDCFVFRLSRIAWEANHERI